ncbi:N-acetyltransferase [Knoellia sp. LjRoot47]|uniref:N-acetyltransferase n=1 Tax=Knoellia sp. LjRoot47 TaxID=3342330 RepID=UPI003ECE37DE
MTPAVSAADLVIDAWRGRYRPADGSWQRIPPWREDLYAVLSFTGHAAVSAPRDVSDEDLTRWGVDGFGGAHDPRVMTRLAGEEGWVDVLDAILVAPGTGAGDGAAAEDGDTTAVEDTDTTAVELPVAGLVDGLVDGLVERPDLARHPRAVHAADVRDDVSVHGWPGRDDVVVTLGRSFGGLAVVSYEIDAAARGTGLGTRTVRAARALVAAGEPVLALVSPGNVASLRAALAGGFEPVGSVQLYRP